MCSMVKAPLEKVQRVLLVIAVLERGEQIETSLERIAVARPERPLKLFVARHAPGRSLFAQKDGLVGLADIAPSSRTAFSRANRDGGICRDRSSRHLGTAQRKRQLPAIFDMVQPVT